MGNANNNLKFKDRLEFFQSGIVIRNKNYRINKTRTNKNNYLVSTHLLLL